VRLRRAFGFGATSDYDPFLLLDDFRNERPEDYLPGFPWHPHRGIETITYVLAGTVEHGDSMGNRGSIGAGDIQWMTAGRGIIHQEMPTGDAGGRMHGFQLWANLPSSLKMTAPRYQDVKAKDVPVAVDDDGTEVRIVCGNYRGRGGPVHDIAAKPVYSHWAALQRNQQAGAVLTSWLQVLLEFQREWTRREMYEAARAIVVEHAGGYGIGLDYARDMIKPP
jgi:redox-sensitive bicupin YhaK (pirin superfamily)